MELVPTPTESAKEEYERKKKEAARQEEADRQVAMAAERAEFERTGGPAHPTTRSVFGSTIAAHPGLTIRDYFAAQAAAALITRVESNVSIGDCAQRAYQIADSMLEARKAVANG